VLFGKLKRGGTVKVTVVNDAETGKPKLKLEAIGDEVPVSPKKEDPKKVPAPRKKAKKPASSASRTRKPPSDKGASSDPDVRLRGKGVAKRSIVPQLPRKS
jgi:ATP-dependent Clp protease ATP-binding subunit ClpA